MTAPEPGNLSTPEAEAAYEAAYGERYGAHDDRPEPEPEPEPTPYDLWLTDDPEATWDDPNLAGPADRPVRDRAAELEFGPEPGPEAEPEPEAGA